MKKRLQQEKKIDAFSFTRMLVNDIKDCTELLSFQDVSLLHQRHYETGYAGLSSKNYRGHFPYWLRMYVQGELKQEDFDRQRKLNAARPYTPVVFHVESAIVHSAFKYFLRNRNAKVDWDTYYKSILVELPVQETRVCIEAAHRFACPIHYVSTTPVQYQEYVLQYLNLYGIKNYATEIHFKKQVGQTDTQFLRRRFNDIYQNASSGWFIYNTQEFWSVGWDSLIDLRKPWLKG